ncbi:MAG: helix-turn-helix domain-containing protein [Nitrososphaerales archaeon]
MTQQEVKIIQIVCRKYGITTEQIMCKRRLQQFVRPRQIAQYFMCKKNTGTLRQIGRIFDADHATVIHSEKKIRGLTEIYPAFRKEIEELDYEMKLKF